VPAGEIAVISVALSTTKLVTGVEPNLTAVARVKWSPVIVTLVPPAAGPEDGLTPVTVGRCQSVHQRQ
jgi:hypothetical protein